MFWTKFVDDVNVLCQVHIYYIDTIFRNTAFRLLTSQVLPSATRWQQVHS